MPKLLLALALLLTPWSAPAHEAPQDLSQEDVKTGITLICGTADEAKHFVAETKDLQKALTAVEEQAGLKSCVVAPIAYIAGKSMDRIEHSAGTFIVTEILIVGVGTPVGVLAIKPAVVYTVLPVAEQAA
jgi:hypothetical protein